MQSDAIRHVFSSWMSMNDWSILNYILIARTSQNPENILTWIDHADKERCVARHGIAARATSTCTSWAFKSDVFSTESLKSEKYGVEKAPQKSSSLLTMAAPLQAAFDPKIFRWWYMIWYMMIWYMIWYMIYIMIILWYYDIDESAWFIEMSVDSPVDFREDLGWVPGSLWDTNVLWPPGTCRNSCSWKTNDVGHIWSM